jgi:hypothetical protein
VPVKLNTDRLGDSINEAAEPEHWAHTEEKRCRLTRIKNCSQLRLPHPSATRSPRGNQSAFGHVRTEKRFGNNGQSISNKF